MSVRLAAGDWEAVLLPAIGGAIGSLRRRGVDMLRPTRAGAAHPLETACFPLVPYANRIADGRFGFAGERLALPRNVPEEAHPLHGVGWLTGWTVVSADTRHAVLGHDHPGDQHWPWPYRAEQRFDLGKDGLRVALDITCRGPAAMPVSLGMHPYFETDGVTGLRFHAAGVWLADANLLPSELAVADCLGDWSRTGAVTRDDIVDNTYVDWTGEARIARADGDLRLAGEHTPFLHLFVPPGRGFFCAEPVTAMPDAFNRVEPLVLRPGESHAVAMAITSA